MRIYRLSIIFSTISPTPTGGTCPYVWTPLSDKISEGFFLNMNDNSSDTVQYQMWEKGQPNGGENENYVAIAIQTAALQDVDENSRLFCSTCSLSSSLLLRLDGLCEHSFIGNFFIKTWEKFFFFIKCCFYGDIAIFGQCLRILNHYSKPI